MSSSLVKIDLKQIVRVFIRRANITQVRDTIVSYRRVYISLPIVY